MENQVKILGSREIEQEDGGAPHEDVPHPAPPEAGEETIERQGRDNDRRDITASAPVQGRVLARNASERMEGMSNNGMDTSKNRSSQCRLRK